MVVPLLSGSGIRIKIIEGMACRKPVISTTTGAEGIEVTDNEDIMLADTPEEFAAAIEALTENPARAAAMAHNARSTIEKKYDNVMLMKQLTDFYKKL
jgi:glycosyltransferase involved in cell wall biosynthesis